VKDLINTGQDRSKTKVTQRSSVVGTTASTFEKLGEVLLDLAKGISEVRKEQAEDYEALTVVLRGQEKRMDEWEKNYRHAVLWKTGLRIGALEENQKAAIEQFANILEYVDSIKAIVDELEEKISKRESHRLDLPINGGNDNMEEGDMK